MSYNLSNTIIAVQNGELDNLSDRLHQVANHSVRAGGYKFFVIHDLELKSSGIAILIDVMRLVHASDDRAFHYSLVLQHVTVSPEVFRELMGQLQLFQGKKPVRVVHEAGAPIQHQWVDSITQSVCNNLVLNCMGLTDEYIADLVPALLPMRCHHLDLSYNEITSQGALKFLSNSFGLSMLDLSNNKIGRTLVPEFVKLISAHTFTCYSYIDLQNDGWTDQDIELIHSALSAQDAIIEVSLRQPDKPGITLGPYAPYTENHYSVGVVPSLVMEHIVTALIKTVEEKLSTVDEERRLELLSGLSKDLRRLTQKPYPLELLDLKGFKPNLFLLNLIQFMLQEMNDLNRFEIPVKNHEPEFFDGLLELIRTQPKLKELRISIVDLDSDPVVNQHKFAQLCAVVQNSRTLKSFFVHGVITEAAHLQPVVQLILHNFSLNKLDIQCRNTISQPVLDALSFNFFITTGMTGMGAPYPIRRNYAIAQLPWRERINRIRALVAALPEELRNPEKAHLRDFPSLQSLAEAKQKETEAPAQAPAPSLTVNAPTTAPVPAPQVKKPEEESLKTLELFMKLIQFLENEIIRLEHASKQRIKSSGVAVKLAFLKQLKSKAYPFIDKPEALSMNQVINFCRQTAIISHHRRHWVLNNLFSVVNKKYREAESWRQFRYSFDKESVANDIMKQFNPRKPLKIELDDGSEKEIHSYKQYSEVMKVQ